jgi:hypothetical protein
MMNRFPPRTPRAAFGLAAIALTALTFGLAVVAPARLDSANTDARPPVTVADMKDAASEAAVIPYRIEVVGVRDPNLASSRSPAGDTRCAPQG